jgi:hypothetical protein
MEWYESPMWAKFICATKRSNLPLTTVCLAMYSASCRASCICTAASSWFTTSPTVHQRWFQQR